MAIHGAVKYASNHVRDFIQLSDEYAIYETSVPPKWVGKSILDLQVRKKYHLNILAIKRDGQIDPEGKDRLPGGSVKIAASSALILYRQ